MDLETSARVDFGKKQLASKSNHTSIRHPEVMRELLIANDVVRLLAESRKGGMELNMLPPKIQTPKCWSEFLYHDNSRDEKTVLKIRWP